MRTPNICSTSDSFGVQVVIPRNRSSAYRESTSTGGALLPLRRSAFRARATSAGVTSPLP
jgi:hypothetical protein